MVFGVGVVAVLVLVGVVSVGRVVRTPRPAARIHVDDLAVGSCPDICVVTGVPTTHRVEVSSTEGGFQAWWLILVLFGPVGWVALFVVAALARRPGRVSGMLAVSPEAVERYVAASRLARWAIALGGIIAVGGVVVIAEHGSNLPRGLLVAGGLAVLAVLVVGLGATIVAPLRWFDLHLDGSGRWVTVQRAHPAFAAAVRQHNALTHARRL